MNKENEYTCPICRKGPKKGGFRRKYKWKTERGFKNHPCYAEVLKWQEKQAEIKTTEEEEKRRRLEERIKNGKYKVGDEIFYCNYCVTKPTHERRGSRMVKVRYEEVRSFYSSKGKIQKITLHGIIVNGVHISDSAICNTLEEAENIADKAQKGYEDHCNFSSMCR